jgi:hypothetical protein
MKDSAGKPVETYRSMPLYVILSCGIILIIVGIGLMVSHDAAVGKAWHSYRSVRRGESLIVTSPASIILGILMSIFPAYQLIKKALKK